MTFVVIILRIIHIFSGVYWVGVAFLNIIFLQPAVLATGAEGQKFMRHLMQQTRLASATYATATLTFLSGFFLYWIISGLREGFLSSGYGLVLTTGSITGTIAWLVVIFPLRKLFAKMAAIGQQLQTQGGPPTPEQTAQMMKWRAQLASFGRGGLVLLTITLLAMATAGEIPL
jgi:uncharacterized membrane protein